MVKIPQELKDLFCDPQASRVLVAVEPTGKPHVSVKGRFVAVDDTAIAFADLDNINNITELKSNQEATVRVFKMPSHGYQLTGKFREYQTSGPIFDQWKKLLQEKGKKIKRIGIINVEIIQDSSDLTSHEAK